LDKFLLFIGPVAKKFGKKPLHLHKSVVAEFREDMDIKQFLEKIKETKVVGVLAILDGMTDDRCQAFEDTCDDEEVFFKKVPGDTITKRMFAVDLVLEMMLLRAG